jgi:hypothetical protein
MVNLEHEWNGASTEILPREGAYTISIAPNNLTQSETAVLEFTETNRSLNYTIMNL